MAFVTMQWELSFFFYRWMDILTAQIHDFSVMKILNN